MTYDLRVKIKGYPFGDDVTKGTDDEMTEGGDGQQDDTIDHDRSEDVPKSTGQPNQIADAPVDKGTTPTATLMAGLRFGSFGAASAPSHLWGDRAETRDQEPPLV